VIVMHFKNMVHLATITRTRKALLALLIFILAAWGSIIRILQIESNSATVLTDGEIMIRIIALPAFISMFIAFLTTMWASPHAKSNEVSEISSSRTRVKQFQAQVVGLQWMNPLQRMDYPTEWQLLWTMDLVKPNPNDDMVRKNPDRYSSIQPIRSIVSGADGRVSFKDYFETYIEELTYLYRDKYFSNSKYFYNAHSIKDKSTRRELAGIHVEIALPSKELDVEVASASIRNIIRRGFDIVYTEFPNAWTRDTPADVHITPGGANAGFTSLKQGLDYLQQHPSETVWVMNWDAPSRPKDRQIDENLVLLVLAGPDYKTDRAPLAWLSYPAQAKVDDFPSDTNTPRQIQAWKAVLDKSAQHAGKLPSDIGFVIHDANSTHPQSSDRLAGLARTVTENIPELDFMKQTFNTSALLGELRAGSALTNVALAIAYANHIGKTVLVAGTTDLEQPIATVVTPPAVVRPIRTDVPWFRARGANNAYLTWWGLRHDSRPLPQGYSE